ncbi:unnamed protein product [Moneuplotes crassus]|uniref:Uncharacterized protein n=1 Tax=Euplotes crassus TaxID=5936 RepID=A0AAD1YAX9_EUPCR|nr:unnamed protein product [Moneuplotes crassus]
MRKAETKSIKSSKHMSQMIKKEFNRMINKHTNQDRVMTEQGIQMAKFRIFEKRRKEELKYKKNKYYSDKPWKLMNRSNKLLRSLKMFDIGNTSSSTVGNQYGFRSGEWINKSIKISESGQLKTIKLNSKQFKRLKQLCRNSRSA